MAGPGEACLVAGDAVADGNQIGRKAKHIEVALLHDALKGLQIDRTALLRVGGGHGLVDEGVELGILNAAPENGVGAVAHQADIAQENVRARSRVHGREIPVVLAQALLRSDVVERNVIDFKAQLADHLHDDLAVGLLPGDEFDGVLGGIDAGLL